MMQIDPGKPYPVLLDETLPYMEHLTELVMRKDRRDDLDLMFIRLAISELQLRLTRAHSAVQAELVSRGKQ